MKLEILRAAKPFCFIYDFNAAKEHRCEFCKEIIHKGDLYWRKRGMTCLHNFYDHKYCDKCYSKENI